MDEGAGKERGAATMSLRRLPRLRSTLRRELPGPKNAYSRFTITRTAEYAAAGELACGRSVLYAVTDMHRARVSPRLEGELRRALELDLPEPAEEEAQP